MPRNRKPVRLITNLLNQMQCRLLWAGNHSVVLIRQDEGFKPRLASCTLGHTQNHYPDDTKITEYLSCNAYLPLAAINQ